MKKTERFEMRASESFFETLDLIRKTKPGIRTRAAAVEYCIDVVRLKMEAKEKKKTKEIN